jgi:hypothetical protein
MDDAFQDYTWVLGALALLLVVFDVFWLTRKPRATRPLGASPPPLPERSVRERSARLGRAA